MTTASVRYFILCDEILIDPKDPRRVTLVAVNSVIRSSSEPSYPFVKKQLCVFIQLVECRGDAVGQVRFIHADTEEVAFESQIRPLSFRHDPLHVYGLRFRFVDCVFPEPGLYLAQFWYNDQTVAQQPLLLK